MNSHQSNGPTTRSMLRSGISNRSHKSKFTEVGKKCRAKIKTVTESEQTRPKRILTKGTCRIENRKRLNNNKKPTMTIRKSAKHRTEQKANDKKIISLKSNTTNNSQRKGRQSKGHKTKEVNAIKGGALSSNSNNEERYFRAEKIISIQKIDCCNTSTICPVSENTAWVGFDFSNTIYLYDKLGEIQNTLKMPACVDDIAVKNDGSLLVTRHAFNKMWVVDKTYTKIKDLKGLNVESLIGRGLYVGNNNETYLCFAESLSDNHKTSKGVIALISDTGEIIKTHETLYNDKTFHSFYRIAVNVNGDILVVERGKFTGSLVILDSNGREKSRWTGILGQKKRADIYGVCCNDEGFIFVSDCEKGSVEVLYPDGTFCQTLISGLGPINNIKMDKIGHLWVGCFRNCRVDIFNVFKNS